MKKLLCTILALAMIVSTVSFAVFAENIENLGGADFNNNSGSVYDGTNYYASLTEALAGVHAVKGAVLYCKPNADLGTMTHGHVCRNLTVYGNGAHLSGGEQDFEIDYPKATGNACSGLTEDVTLTVYNLTGAGAWGSRTSEYNVNYIFEDCANMGKVYLTGTSGTNNITMTDCTFTSNDISFCKVSSKAAGTITLTNVDFSNIAQPVALNNESTGTQTIVLKDCDFDTCGAATDVWTVPVSVKSSVDGGNSMLTVDNCTFVGTVANSIGQDADILLDYGVGVTSAAILKTAAKVGVEAEDNKADYAILTTNDAALMTNENAQVQVPVASVNGVFYTDLAEAFKAVKEESVIEILSNVTINSKWNCNFGRGSASGTFNNNKVTINGNKHILKFTGEINDGYNNLAVIRTESALTVNNLTFDMSEAVAVFQNRFSAISSEGAELVVDGCNFIGSTTYTNARAIIYGETNKSADILENAEVTITDCVFTNWNYGVTDGMNGKDVKEVTVLESDFINSNIQISASDEVTLTNNTVTGADVKVTSNSEVTELKVTANGNTLDETATNYINANEIVTDSDEFDLPVADIAGKKYISLADAAKDVEAGETATITITDNISDENVTITGNVSLEVADSVSLLATSATTEPTTLTNVIFTVESGASLSLDGFAIRGFSYIYAKTPDGISVTNCDIDVTTVEVSGTNCPPGFVLFDSNNGGSVELTFTNNTLLATPDVTEDWYTYSHGIAGWNAIEKATITGNTFGSAEAPLGAAAVKLMNFVEGATVTASGNTFYVNSQDSTWGPNAFQLYQNNSRANNYTATISDNDFYVDANTAAVGINVNADGNPDVNTGGGLVVIDDDNTVNGEAISISDVIAFGNGINDIGYTRRYVGVGVKYDEEGKIIDGMFSANSLGVEAAVADAFQVFKNSSGNYYVVDGTVRADTISVEYKDITAADEKESKTFEIVLKANDGDQIHELASADLSFDLSAIANPTDAAMSITVLPAPDFTLTQYKNEDRYMFNYSGIGEAYQGSGNTITIGTITVNGYGQYKVATKAADTNIVNATTVQDNLVDSFTAKGENDNDPTTGILVINNDTNTGDLLFDKFEGTIAVPTYTLDIEVAFPNTVKGNDVAYQNMTVSIVGGNINKVIKLGNTPEQTTDDYPATFSVGTPDAAKYDISMSLPYNTTYTVTVEGLGYRTARHSVTLTGNKKLKFWNNVKDAAEAIEAGKTEVTKNFLAGDIVKDNNINVYDLSAVVSYFGTSVSVEDAPTYAKYDLNRDGVIDSLDVAYILVSWNE